ncbi:MAG TPA: shikimate dehydrogenase, partial [Nitrospiria bacterium]|nr:shikimate dehydrogenase [Nitrospiria bacterium]
MTVDGKTKLVGIIGFPVAHSLSPLMQNAAFRARGLNWCYIPLELDPRFIKKAVRALPLLGFAGFNVTIPHKQKIIPMLDRLTPEARFIGAVNTVAIKKGELTGYNTDAEGFLRALKEGSRKSPR